MPQNKGKIKRYKNLDGLSVKSIFYLPAERSRPDYISFSFSRLVEGDYPFLPEELRLALILTFRGLGLSGFYSSGTYLGADCLVINRIGDEGYTPTGGKKTFVNRNYRQQVEERENKLRDFLTQENEIFRNEYLKIIKNCTTQEEFGIKIQEAASKCKPEFIQRLKEAHQGIFGVKYTSNTNRPKLPVTISESAWIAYSNLRKMIPDEELLLVAFDSNGNPRKPDPVHHPKDPIVILYSNKPEVLKKVKATFTQPMENQEEQQNNISNNAAFSEELSKHHRDLIFLNLHRREGNIAQSETPQDILEAMLKECGITAEFRRYPEYATERDILGDILKEHGITTSFSGSTSYSELQFALEVAPDGSEKVVVLPIPERGRLHYQPPARTRVRAEDPPASMSMMGENSGFTETETFISPAAFPVDSSSSLADASVSSLSPPTAKRKRVSITAPTILDNDSSDDTNSIRAVMKELTRVLKKINLEEGSIDQRVSTHTEDNYEDALLKRLSKEPPEKRMEIETIRKAIFGACDDVGKWVEITDQSLFSEMMAYILIDVCFEEFEKIDKDNFLPIDLNGITFVLYSQNTHFLEKIRDMNADYIAEDAEDEVYDTFIDMLVNFVLLKEDLDGRNKLLILNPLSENEDNKVVDVKEFYKDKGFTGVPEIEIEKALREKLALMLEEFETPAFMGDTQQTEFSDLAKQTKNKSIKKIRCQVNGMDSLRDYDYTTDEKESDEESETDLQPEASRFEGNTVPGSPDSETIDYLETELVNAGIFPSPKTLEQVEDQTSDSTRAMDTQVGPPTVDLYEEIRSDAAVPDAPVSMELNGYGQPIWSVTHQPTQTDTLTTQSIVDLYKEVRSDSAVPDAPVFMELNGYGQPISSVTTHQPTTQTDTLTTQSIVDLYKEVRSDSAVPDAPVFMELNGYGQPISSVTHQPTTQTDTLTTQSIVDLYKEIRSDAAVPDAPVSMELNGYGQPIWSVTHQSTTQTDTLTTQSIVDLYKEVRSDSAVPDAPVSMELNGYGQPTWSVTHQPTQTDTLATQSIVDLYKEVRSDAAVPDAPVSMELNGYGQPIWSVTHQSTTQTDTLTTQSIVDLYKEVRSDSAVPDAPVSMELNGYGQPTWSVTHQPTQTDTLATQSIVDLYKEVRSDAAVPNASLSIGLTAESACASLQDQQSTGSPLRTPEILANSPFTVWRTYNVTQREDSIDLDEEIIPVFNQT